RGSGGLERAIRREPARRMSRAVRRPIPPGKAIARCRGVLGASPRARLRGQAGGAAVTTGFPGLTVGSDPRDLAAVVNRMNLGRLNCVGEVTLRPDQTSTVVADSRVTAGSFVGLTPLSPEAAAELASGAVYVTARAQGSFTLA